MTLFDLLAKHDSFEPTAKVRYKKTAEMNEGGSEKTKLQQLYIGQITGIKKWMDVQTVPSDASDYAPWVPPGSE